MFVYNEITFELFDRIGKFKGVMIILPNFFRKQQCVHSFNYLIAHKT